MKNLLVFLGLIILSSCGSSSETTSGEELDGTYSLVAVDGKDIASNGLVFKFNSAENRIVGETGCNNFSASYLQEGNNISFNQPISTRKYCEGKMELEAKILSILPQISEIRSTANQLTFSSENEEVLFTLKKK